MWCVGVINYSSGVNQVWCVGVINYSSGGEPGVVCGSNKL